MSLIHESRDLRAEARALLDERWQIVSRYRRAVTDAHDRLSNATLLFDIPSAQDWKQTRDHEHGRPSPMNHCPNQPGVQCSCTSPSEP